MLILIGELNGQKIEIPVTADAGAGNPVGSYLYLEKKSNPQGYLYCDGSTFDETKYPLLYDYLGSNVLPDWRELGAKGAEKNTTLIFDSTETDPSTGQAGTQNHDVFTQGEFKDDQVQQHSHNVTAVNASQNKARTLGSGDAGFGCSNAGGNPFVYEQGQDGRKGTVTRGKSRAVFIYIKATSGLSENAQDNVVAQLNEERSYSTEEVNTGKKWIDGKPIYRKVVDCGALPNNDLLSVAHNVSNIDKIINLSGFCNNNATYLNIPYTAYNGEIISAYCDATHIRIRTNSDWSVYTAYTVIEYTKTTD